MAEREANRPTIDELSERIRRRGRFALGESSADIVRGMRDAAGGSSSTARRRSTISSG
jgi:hypothetical protein